MKNITIKKLTLELKDDYLDFFDNRAFSDGNPNGPCYCTSPNQDKETIKQMVSEFQANGIKETIRKYAVKMLEKVRSKDIWHMMMACLLDGATPLILTVTKALCLISQEITGAGKQLRLYVLR